MNSTCGIMLRHIVLFSIAFIFTLCLFWMQIQIGRCKDNLGVWYPKYWISTSQQGPIARAGDAYYNTTKNEDTPTQNMEYENTSLKTLNGTSFGSDVESNQVNELDVTVIDQTGESDSPLNVTDPGNWLNEKRRRPKGITVYSIRSSDEKDTQTTGPKENLSGDLRPISTHKRHYKKQHSSSRQIEPMPMKYKKKSGNKAKNKKLVKKHENKERMLQENTPLVEHSTYKQGEATYISDAEPETTYKPETKANFENELKAEKTKSTIENSIEAEIKYTTKSTTESVLVTEQVEELIRPKLRLKNEQLTKGNDVNNNNENISSVSESVSRENNKPKELPNIQHKNNKWPGRSGKKRVSKKAARQGDSPDNSRLNRKTALVSSLKYLAPHSIKRQLNCLTKKLESRAVIEQEVIGRTVEYNDIILWKMRELPDNRKGFKYKNYRFRGGRSKYVDEIPEKKIVFIVHGLNVMGWHKLKCLSEVKSFETLLGYYIDNLDCFDIYLIPMANPDGVQMSAAQGFWNKNVSPQKACPGVNLDRNFDVGWNSSYAKTSSCSQQYPGPRPLSEHETKAIREVFNQYGHKMIAFFHVHSSSYDTTVFRGDAVLYPKGYTDAQTDDDRYVDFKGELDEAMRNTSFKVLGVTVDTLHSWYGKVIGTSVDYASTVFGIPFAFDFSMQIYEDDTMVTKEEDREQNTALVELWQIVIDIAFSHIHNNTEITEQ